MIRVDGKSAESFGADYPNCRDSKTNPSEPEPEFILSPSYEPLSHHAIS
jgi:hypothetical protein